MPSYPASDPRAGATAHSMVGKRNTLASRRGVRWSAGLTQGHLLLDGTHAVWVRQGACPLPHPGLGLETPKPKGTHLGHKAHCTSPLTA